MRIVNVFFAPMVMLYAGKVIVFFAHFICEARGVIEVKGKGPMEIWHVLQERESPQ